MPFMAARQAATSTSGRSAEVTSSEPGRKCSSICGMLRAQKVTDFTRRVWISPSLTISALRWRHISIARVAISSKLHGTQPNTGNGLLANSCLGSILATLALLESSKISERSGRVRPCSSTGALSLLIITPVMFLFLLPPKLLWVSSIRSFSCAGESLPSAITNTISAFSVLAIS